MLTFTELRGLESRAIQAIRTEGAFGRLRTLSLAARRAQINSGPKVPLSLNLSFTLPTRLREDAGHSAIERAFHVGCFATPHSNNDEISQLSYSVLICQDAYPGKRVARKFHFDYEPASLRDIAESKPTFHLQLCGELSPDHESEGYKEEHIDHLLPSWSQPRVPAQPMSLALVLNWLFIEFGREPSVSEARLNPRWRKLVRDAERSVLKKYYEDCFTFLSSRGKDDESFFSSQIYEENKKQVGTSNSQARG